MSATDDEPPRLRRAADWTVRLGLPLAVLAVVLAVFVTEQAGVAHELSIVAPASAAAGEPIPVRALIFDLSREGAPRLIAAPVSLTLRDGDRVLAEATLEPSVAGGAEGHIDVPPGAPARLTLEGAALDGSRRLATARRALTVDADPERLELVGRAALPMQLFDPGFAHAVGDGPTPSLQNRVVGGACVPETECEVLVDVGVPGAEILLDPHTAMDVGAADPPGRTWGIVRVPVTVHGPAASVRLEARRDGALVAWREVRLPVALATAGVAVDERMLPLDRAPRVEVSVLGDRPGVILDAFRDERWRHTGSTELSDDAVEAAPAPLTPGLWRLQVRTDPFGSERAAVRMIMVGGDLDRALAAIGRLGGDSSAPVAQRPDLRFAWAAASLEDAHYELPAPISGHEADVARLRARRGVLRLAAVVALALGLLVAAVVLLRRGVEAAVEAQRVMEATGDPELTSARHRRRTLLSALAIVATVLLAFVGAAALIVARAHLLD